MKNDVESVSEPLYPTMLESPELRWAFIRKVYSIVAVQLLFTIAFGAFVVNYTPISNFFFATYGGLVVYIVILFTPIITLCPLSCYYQRHPVNYILLAIFTLAFSSSVGLTCGAFTSGKVLLEAVILTFAIVISLTLYTFWAAKRGHEFTFLPPFLVGVFMVFVVFAIIQICYPFGKISSMIYGGLGAIIYCAFIVYDTLDLIARYSYDEYIWAAISLYLDIINLFLMLLRFFKAADR